MLAVGDDIQLLFNWSVFSKRLIQVRSGPPGAQKENLWGLPKLQDSLYGLDSLPVAKPTVAHLPPSYTHQSNSAFIDWL